MGKKLILAIVMGFSAFSAGATQNALKVYQVLERAGVYSETAVGHMYLNKVTSLWCARDGNQGIWWVDKCEFTTQDENDQRQTVKVTGNDAGALWSSLKDASGQPLVCTKNVCVFEVAAIDCKMANDPSSGSMAKRTTCDITTVRPL